VHVKSVTVKNYRSLADVTVNLDGLTVLIGPNGSGKTSVLRALELFSDEAPPVSMDDFGDREKDMEIDLVLSCDCADAALAPYVIDGEIRLRRAYTAPGSGSKPVTKNYIRARLNTDFDKIRWLTRKNEIQPVISALKKQDIYADLPECVPSFREWEPRFLKYERDFLASNPGHARVRLDCVKWDTSEVRIDRLLDVVYVPAMRDIVQDGSGGSGSYLGKLTNMAIERAWEADEGVGVAAASSVLMHDSYRRALDASVVPRLNEILTAKSSQFAGGASATVGLGKARYRLPPQSPDMALIEAGHQTDIERVGGGLQRAYLMALLVAISELDAEAPDREPGSRARLVMIDEPEIYQHPQRQRHMLHELMGLSGPGSGMQILCSTHSPYFIELSRIDGLRLLTRDGHTSVHVATRQEIMGPILERYSTSLPDDDALNRWLGANASHWITEGFFARLVVLVEGIDDRNVLLATASVLGTDLNEHEISIVPVNGKPRMCPTAHLFRPFGIPLYLVWDLDDGNDDGEENDRLLRLANPDSREIPANLKDATITDRFSCFRTNLTALLHREITDCKRALKRVGGWNALLGQHALKIKKQQHCKTCACEGLEPTEGIKQLLGSRDVVLDLLAKIREADGDAFDSLTPVRVVRMLEKAGKAARHATEKIPTEGCADGNG